MLIATSLSLYIQLPAAKPATVPVKHTKFWIGVGIELHLLWGHFRQSWGHFGPSWSHFGPSWGHPGAIWGPHGAIWGTSKLQKERQPLEEARVSTYVDALWAKVSILRHVGAFLGLSWGYLGPLWAHLGDVRWPGPPRSQSGTHGEPQGKRPAVLQPTESKHFHATSDRQLA